MTVIEALCSGRLKLPLSIGILTLMFVLIRSLLACCFVSLLVYAADDARLLNIATRAHLRRNQGCI